MSPGSSASSPPTASTAASTQKFIVPMKNGRLGACASRRICAVVDRDREVEHLVDDRRERRADQRALHLLGGRVEAVPDHLGGDRVGVDGAARAAQSGAVDDRLAGHRQPPVVSRISRIPRRHRRAVNAGVEVCRRRLLEHDRRALRAASTPIDGASTIANGSRSPRVNDHASSSSRRGAAGRRGRLLLRGAARQRRAHRRSQRDDLDRLVHRRARTCGRSRR